MTITPLDARVRLTQTFSRCWISSATNGDVRIALDYDPIDDIPPAPAGAPHAPVKSYPLRHVLLIRLLWEPLTGRGPDTLAATNAVLDWYVMNEPDSPAPAILHYSGTAFLSLIHDSAGSQVTLRNGQLDLLERTGDIRDPFGTFRVDGLFEAISNDEMVQRLTSDVRVTSNAARAVQQATNLPPPPEPTARPIDVMPTSAPSSTSGPAEIPPITNIAPVENPSTRPAITTRP